MDHAAWLAAGMSGASEEAKKSYAYFMRPEPKDGLGPLVVEDDPVTGRKMRTRTARIGMVRNAEEDDKLDVKVYLDPLPHIRIAKAKDLQGWYQSKSDPDEHHRPRPCFTDAVLTEPYGGYCLPPDALVETPAGPRMISELRVGDYVFGKIGEKVLPVLVENTVNRWKSDGLVRLRLETGATFDMTGDHPVYSSSRGDYVPAQQLRPGEKLEALSFLRRAEGETISSVLSELPLRSLEDGATGSGGQHSEEVPGLRRSADEDGGTLSVMPPSSFGPERQDAKGSPGSVDGVTALPSNEAKATSGESREAPFTEDASALRAASAGSRHRGEAVQEELLRLSARTNPQPSIELGAAHGPVARRSQTELGLRAGSSAVAERSRLPAGLQARRRTLRRGEGLPESARRAEDPRGPVGWSQSSPLDGSEARSTRNPAVTELERLPAPLRVYDIQTASGNFYVRGSDSTAILVHNCTVGCAFCYVNSGFRGYRGSGLITVPLDYGAQVGRQLDKMKTSAAGYFSSFTDPFLPLEDYYHNTQRGAEAFVSRGLPIFFLSRLSYPSWARTLLQHSKYSYAQKSINTPWEPDWQKLSPGAISLEEHLQEIRELRALGIYVSIQVNPIIAGITTHDDVRHLFGLLAAAGANHVIVKFVEAGYSWAPTMIANMRARFGEERAAEFEKLFTCNIGHQKTVDEQYRLTGHRLYQGWARELGLTYATCYEYKFERAPDGEKLSSRGTSIGKEFLTADQCHGHRVPMFSRESLNEPFREVEVCPPSGCLSCADDNAGLSRCGSELFGAAKALRLPDFKFSVWAKSKGLPVAGERPNS